MKITAIEIERSTSDYSFCGTLSYESPEQIGTLLWTVDCVNDTKIDVAFVQGNHEDWVEVAQNFAHDFSDNIILMIARQQPLPTLATNLSYFMSS